MNLKQCFYRPAHCFSSLWKIKNDNCFDKLYRERQFPWFHSLTKNSYLTSSLPHVSKLTDIKSPLWGSNVGPTKLSCVLPRLPRGNLPASSVRGGEVAGTRCRRRDSDHSLLPWWLSGWLLLCHHLIWVFSQKKKKKKVMPVFYNVLFQQRESSRERTGPWKSKAWNSSFLSFHFKQETSRLRGSGGSIGCVFILRQIMFVCCKCQWFIPRA